MNVEPAGLADGDVECERVRRVSLQHGAVTVMLAIGSQVGHFASCTCLIRTPAIYG